MQAIDSDEVCREKLDLGRGFRCGGTGLTLLPLLLSLL